MVRPKFVGLFSLSEGKKNHGFSTSPHTLFFFFGKQWDHLQGQLYLEKVTHIFNETFP